MRSHIVIFSHGFGVRSDSRGMFTDIAAALPVKTILFDYNRFDEKANTLRVAPLDVQAEKLRSVIAETRAQNPDAIIDLVCHSQGCVVAGLAKPSGLRKIILTGPPATLSAERMAKVFGGRPGAKLDFDGQSTFPRRDGTTTIVPQAYWSSIKGFDPIELFNQLAEIAEITVISANQDEIIGDKDFSRLGPHIKTINLDGSHDFTGQARFKLAELVAKELA